MQIIWYGHSCFLIKSSLGKKILIDPFDDSIGYKNEFPKCDLILTTHPHLKNSYLNNLDSTVKVINTYGTFDLDYVKIKGFNSFHDNYHGFKRGYNIIYLISLDNLTICHLGDLGAIPSFSILNELSNLDVLFIPIGGQFTLDSKLASELCNILSPKIIVPMHYKTNRIKIPLDSCKDFITILNNIKNINTNTLNIDPPLNCKNQILLLNPPLV